MTRAGVGRRILGFLLVTILLICSVSPCFAVNLPEKRVVRVGFYSLPGYQTIDEHGSLGGYAYDYYQALSQYTGWDIEYVTGYNWSECLEMLASGELDLLAGVLKTDEREQVFDFPDVFSGMGYSCLSVLKNNTQVGFEDYASFDGMKVGVAKGSARNEKFLEYCRSNGFSATLNFYDSAADFEKALLSGEIDAVMITSNFKVDGFRVVAKFDPEPQYIVTYKGNTELLDELNRALTRLKTDVPNFDDELFSLYYGSSTDDSVVFSRDEKAYIAAHPTAKVIYDPNCAPIELLDENGQAHGISIDILNVVSEICGIKFEFVTANSFSQSLAKFQSGDAQIFSSITYDYGWAEHNNMYLTQPYLDIPFVSIFKYELVDDLRVAMPRGYYLTHYLESADDSPQIIYYDTENECIDAVNRGDADYTLVNSYQADYYLSMPKYRALSFRTVQSVPQRLSIAVSQDADPLLFSILCKSINGVSRKTISSIIRTHTDHSRNASFLDMLYTNPPQFFAITFVCVFLLITIFVVFFFFLTNKKKNHQLQRALDAKSSFLSNMSHDMRTPMNGILGLLDLTMDAEGLSAEIKENLHGMQDSGKYLLCLINDSLDMSKLDSDKLTLNYELSNVSELINNIMSCMKPSAVQAGVDLSLELKSVEPGYIRTDPLRLHQIFVNIVSNAIKFTPRGGSVKVVIECCRREDGIDHCRISIKDTGIGMSREFLPKIFEPFEQENSIDAQNGTGLGMSIVKKLVEMMNGSIEVLSEKSVGTEVIVWLDFEHTDPQSGSAPSAPEPGDAADSLSGKRVLVAEDHPLNAKIATKLLEKAGMTVEVVENGQLAVDSFAASAVGYYDGVLMDIRMPVMGGLQAARTIRALNRPDAASVPIIAMTANAFDEDIKSSVGAGMNAHLSKPIDPEKLYGALRKLLNGRQSE